ncbi:MAG: methyltransferase, CheR-type [Verrucomicrobiales bacterium]|nr:methyltransferase, CheR-type [Verrucomicrobiales bacterium]
MSCTPLLAPNEGLSILIRDLIHERLGLFFDPARLEVMLDKITPLAQAQGCRSYIDYYYQLKDTDITSAYWQAVMDALSVQETYFWRELDQIKTLAETLVAKWFQERLRPLRIWSAACATGEEPYTIAMALIEAGHGHLPVEIVGSDGSPAALVKAQRGLYRERSFRTLPPELRSKYFEEKPDGWQISPAIQRRVRFQRANLMEEPEIVHLASSPIVFCRNVFIYFSPNSIRRALQVFAARMEPGSHLFVGSSESLLKLTNDFELQELGSAFAYVRKGKGLFQTP